MRILAAVAGLALIVVILIDCFQAMILPRRVVWRWRPARFFYRTAWTFWRAASHLLPAGKRRDGFFSIFGPLSLPLLFILWGVSLIVGFAVLHLGLALPLNPTGEPGDFLTLLYLSGETFFTLGYGDVTAATPIGRALSVSEAGLGFGFMAVIIGYLPVLYQAFSRRETVIALLDARAGSPPTAAQLLLRLGKSRAGVEAAVPLLAEWERWSAELLESHLSFPVLSYYRSQHDNQSWLAALTAMLDVSALLLTGVEGDVLRYQAQLTFAAARHAAVDLALTFYTPPLPPQPDRLPADTLQLLRQELRSAGVSLREGPAVDAKLTELRGLYEPFVNALADFLRFALPPVRPDKPPVDNWQTSAWMRRAAGFGELPAADDDHRE
ncbi:MAG TPA: potassium channel family protein [Gemmataceae bacterium]|nr:potassium channel family protein [Gemmataceae bacterium]